jgi:hypothetical protein
MESVGTLCPVKLTSNIRKLGFLILNKLCRYIKKSDLHRPVKNLQKLRKCKHI